MSNYWGADFFSFFAILFGRIGQALTGGTLSLAADEVQLAVLSLIALSCGLIGPFLVLKRMTMFANSLSHTILLGIAAAFLIGGALWGAQISDLSTLFLGALLAALLTAFLTEGLTRLFRLQEDASIGLVFTALFALGILLVTIYTRNVHLSVEAVMGNADALQASDLFLSGIIALGNGVILLLLYPKFQIACFDQSLAKTLGIRCGVYHFLLLFMASMTIIGAFRAVGVLVVLAYLVGPYLTARLFSNRLSRLLFWTPVTGILASCAAVALSRHILSVYGMPLSTGGLAVAVMGVGYFGGVFVKLWREERFSKRKSPV